MLKLAWRGVRFNLGRYVATLVAIITGVAFFAASGFLADRVIASLEGDVDRQYHDVDAAVVVDTSGDRSAATSDQLRIGGGVVDEITALPGVAGVAGELTGDVAFLGTDGEVFADGATGRLWIDDGPLNPVDLVEGVAPSAAGEVAVDRGLAAEYGLAVGDTVTMLTLAGETEVTITAITRFGDSDAQDSKGTVSIPAVTAFEWLNRGQVEYASLFLRAEGDPDAVVAEVAPVAPAGFAVVSGDDFREGKRSQVGSIGRVLKRSLQFFALLALLVGGFVIYNTFNVIVAQRTRELAVLAAIGATPKQLKRSLRLEALVIGLAGSVLGVVAGFALAFVLMAVVERLGVALPGRGLQVSPGTVVLSIIFGVIITRVSVMMPARRAGRAQPIEALRQADVGAVTIGKARRGIALGAIGIGVVALLAGWAAPVIGLGAVLVFVGVIMAGPLIALAGSRLLRPILALFGLEGGLAADNVARNPQRTATTSNALLIGVFLVTFVTVAGTSAKDYAVDQISGLSTADFTIESNGGTIDDQLVADLEAVDGVELVTPFRRETVALSLDGTAGSSTNLSSGDIDELVEAAGISLAAGSYDDLGPGTVVLLQSQAPTPDVIGSTATFTDTEGDSVDLRVVGIIGISLDAEAMGAITEASTFSEFVGDTAPTVAFIKTASGAQTDTTEAIERIVERRPDVSLQAGNTIGRFVEGLFGFLISAVNGLLLMSVVIALIGIVNTLTLSILERRRELGLLRIVGMVDRRVRRMVRIESVVIAALGTVSGMALGVFAGFALVTAVDRASDADVPLSLPLGLLGLVLALGLVLGFVAALIPAQRSTRLDVLEAIRNT